MFSIRWVINSCSKIIFKLGDKLFSFFTESTETYCNFVAANPYEWRIMEVSDVIYYLSIDFVNGVVDDELVYG